MWANQFYILFLFLVTKTCMTAFIRESSALRRTLELDKATIFITSRSIWKALSLFLNLCERSGKRHNYLNHKFGFVGSVVLIVMYYWLNFDDKPRWLMPQINVIKSCYGTHGNAVGVGGTHISENLMKVFSSELIPIVSVTNSTKIRVKRQYQQRKFRYSLQVFVFDVPSLIEVETIIEEMFQTVWWNCLASFVLINRSEHCKGSDQLLIRAWTHKMINAKVICSLYDDEVLIIAYNPFIDQAPQPWRFVIALPIFRPPLNNQFILYKRYYHEGKDVCDNLDFKKVKNLNGFPIDVVTKMANLTIVGNENELRTSLGTKSKGLKYMGAYKSDSLDKQKKMYEHILNIFMRHVNGTWTNKTVSANVVPSKTSLKGDIVFGIAPLTRGLENPLSRPFIEIAVQVMTQHRGYMTQLQKIFSVVDISSNIAVCIVLAVTIMFFKCFAKHTFGSACLNIVRIICNTGFENVPFNTSSRLYLATVLLFAVTMQGIYQGNLAALLTNEMPVRNVNTWQDLVDLGHTIYIAWGNIQMFQEPEFEGRIIQMNDEFAVCSEYVLRNSSVACMNHPGLLQDHANIFNLHLSNLFKPTFGAYMISPDWDLEGELNFVITTLFEGDIIVPLHLRKYRKELGYTNVDDVVDDQADQAIRNMTLRDLTFAFVILGIGLLCASVAFVFEIIIYRRQARIKIKKVAVRPFLRTHRP